MGPGGRVGSGGGWEDWTLTRGAEQRQVHVQEERSTRGIRARETGSK